MEHPDLGADNDALVYKVLRANEHALFQAAGQFEGGPDDRRDGFVHLSTRKQLSGTLERHFASETDVVVLELYASAMGEALRWERSRGGALFPHLYAAMTSAMVRSELSLEEARNRA